MTILNEPAHPVIAFLGPEGTYSHAAAHKIVVTSGKPRFLTCPTLEDIFLTVKQGNADYGVVPVENSSEGSVTQTLDCLSNGGTQVFGEIMLRIHHAFMVSAGTDVAAVSRIRSHQQSLGQCRDWLKMKYPDAEIITATSNAEAARLASVEDGTGAIASVNAARIYGMQIVDERIEDTPDNTTRFFVISARYSSEQTGNDKTSLMLSAHDETGVLFKALEPFNRFGVSLTRLESRPSRRAAWSYTFYLDLLGHPEDENVSNALKELEEMALEVTILGSYPRGEAETYDV